MVHTLWIWVSYTYMYMGTLLLLLLYVQKLSTKQTHIVWLEVWLLTRYPEMASMYLCCGVYNIVVAITFFWPQSTLGWLYKHQNIHTSCVCGCIPCQWGTLLWLSTLGNQIYPSENYSKSYTLYYSEMNNWLIRDIIAKYTVRHASLKCTFLQLSSHIVSAAVIVRNAFVKHCSSSLSILNAKFGGRNEYIAC